MSSVQSFGDLIDLLPVSTFIFQGEELSSLIDLFGTDSWFPKSYNEVKLGKEIFRGVEFSIVQTGPNTYEISLTPIKNDPNHCIDLSDPRLADPSKLSWDEIKVDPNLLQAMLFSINGNIGQRLFVLDNWAAIVVYFSSIPSSDPTKLLWMGVAHLCYVSSHYSRGSDDAVFQELAKTATEKGDEFQFLACDDGRYSLVKDANFSAVLCSDFIASYLVVYCLHSKKFQREFEMDEIKARQIQPLVVAKLLKSYLRCKGTTFACLTKEMK
jgi:hypothetical protein